MLKPDLANRVIEEAECFKSEFREVEITKEMVRDYLRNLDFNPEQRAYFYKLVGL